MQWYWVFIIFIICIGFGYYFSVDSIDLGDTSDTVRLCGSYDCVHAFVADTDVLRSRGLMNVAELPDSLGMWFVFDSEAVHTFWMKNTYIPLDMVFVDSDMTVVGIEYAVPCVDGEECVLYGGNVSSRYVLEVAGGRSSELGIRIGETLRKG